MADRRARTIRRPLLSGNTAVAFFILGWGNGMIGPALPWLSTHWAVPLEAAGGLFTMLFLGACVTVGLAGLLLDRVGRKPVLVGGLVLMVVGLVGLANAGSLGAGLALTFVLGLGWGALDVTLNVFVADLYPGAQSSALNLMNGAYGLGALAGPLSVAVALQVTGSPLPVLLAPAALALAGAVAYGVAAFPPHARATAAAPAPAPQPGVWRRPYVRGLILLMFLYVGLEAAIPGWAFSFGRQGGGLNADAAALVVSVFWIVFTSGRLGAGLVARRVRSDRLILGGMVLVITGTGLIAVTGGAGPALFLGAALAGLGCAPVFPTTLGVVNARYPAAAGAASSLVVLGGTLGGAVLPFLTGHLLTAGGVPLAAGFLALAALAVFGLQAGLGRVPAEVPAPGGYAVEVPGS